MSGDSGRIAEGDTVEEAIFNCVDVLKMIAEYGKERSKKIIKDYEDLYDLRKAKRESENEPGLLIGDFFKSEGLILL